MLITEPALRTPYRWTAD